MSGKKNKIQIRISTTLILLEIWTMAAPLGAKAADDAQCESVCRPYVTSGFYDSNGVWDDANNDLCADLGIPMTTSFQSPTPSTSATPSTLSCMSGSTGSSSPTTVTANMYNYFQRNNTSSDQQCNTVGNLSNLCNYHKFNSSVEKYCLAFNAITGKSNNSDVKTKLNSTLDWSYALIALDATAAGICWNACATDPSRMDSTSLGACAAAGATSSALEMTATTMQQSNSAQRYLTQVSSSMGNINWASLGLGAAGGAASVATGISAHGLSKIEDAQKAQKMACASAVLYTALLGLRVADTVLMRNAASDACSSVMGHVSDAAAYQGPSASTTPVVPGGNGIAASSSGGGSGVNSTTTAGTSSLPMSSGVASIADCSAGVCRLNTQGMSQGGATDAQLLRNSPDLAPILSKMPNPQDFANQALTNGAGAALGGMLGGAAGAMGDIATGMAQAVQNDAAKLGAGIGINSAAASYGGGGSANKGSGSSGDSGFGSLFAGGAGGTMGVQGPGLASFGAPSKAPDIWHSEAKGTLFDIVSGKIFQVTQRVK